MPAPGASGPIPTAEPPAWARVRLIEGQSAATMWQVDSATPAAQLAVGSQDGCPWRVTAPRVAPLHFELCWDGSRLWIGDTQQAGGVTVDGEPLAGWLPVAGRARIEFGTAVMLAESSQPAVSVAVPASDGGGDADEDDPTRIHLGGSAPAAVRRPETAEEPTVPVAALRPPKPEPSQPAGVRARLPMPSDPVQTVIAQIYDRPPAGYVPSAPTAWKSDSPPPAQPGTPPPADRRPSPPPADRRLSPPPGAPGIAHATGTPPSGSKTGARALDRLRSVPPRTWALGGITVAALAAVLMMGGGEPEPARPGGGPAVAAAGTEVAAAEPGDTGQRAAGDEPTAKPLEAGGPGAGGEAGAAANAGSETGATAGSEAAGSGSEAASAGSETGATASAGSETGATANAGSEAGATAAAGDGDAAERAAAAPGERASDGAAASPDASALATEKRAAELLAAGRQREALAVYDELARRFPERPAFGAIVTILERQLSERCGPGGEPCSE